MLIQLINKLSVLTMSVLLSGCVINSAAKKDSPNYAPIYTPAQQKTVNTNGSLFNETTTISLFSDIKAHRPGDIITVILSESTSSSKSANVGITKESELSAVDAILLGSTVGTASAMTSDRDFSGGADASQRNDLTGQISVTVLEVWPNGTLVIRGEKWMKLNTGDEFIRVSGIIRPQDVSSDNTIMSHKIANARITYSGDGALADAQKQGFLSRFFTSVYWPF